ncbi:sigma-54-dependent transcriptional regulator [Desertivirga arenae]|uniref:sigma-54-dependent transcriptional regulator n=1 Tax=Desertivirga arenae TaxID=2810309 RepID=UPI001A967E15|nr:sigma-54 dependent transcriptional regulator [Pedobacter sp. SYSU D00823]
MANLLLVEDDATFSELLQGFLQKKGHTVDTASKVKNAEKMLEQKAYNLLLLDYRLPDGTGLDVLSSAKSNGLNIPGIIMTSFNDVRTAVRAMRFGALDYITKPVNPDELLMAVNEALGKKINKEQQLVEETSPVEFIEGNSAASVQLNSYIKLVAPTDMSIIIQGESGTGKEYAAKSIHRNSKRANMPFVSIDCGALSKHLAGSELFGHTKGAFTGAVLDKKGRFEAANGGTLFLDEIGNLDYEVQVQLLRVLQERVVQPIGSNKQIKVDVRIIVATNDDLYNSVSKGEFREDLYHRLNEFKIEVPALRDRDKDLEVFIDHFIKQSNQELDRNVKKVSPDVKDLLLNYDWPGNLRELKNVIKRMVLLTPGEVAMKEALPSEMFLTIKQGLRPNTSDIKAVNEANEKELIAQTLLKVKYNKSQAAKLLNIDRKTLYYKMEKYQIDG